MSSHTCPHHITPRMQDTLDGLLEGLGEKQIAKALRLSPHTVHDHVKSLHKYHGVSSNSELLLKVLRDGKGRGGPPGRVNPPEQGD